MNKYYYECQNGNGSFYADNDALALIKGNALKDLLILYKENETPDGAPFIMVYEKKLPVNED